ncbi:hypothetical protein HDU93_008910, partial [Gonapodya sp. JEL0774]
PLLAHPSHLWRGTLPTLLRNVPGSALYFASLAEIRSFLNRSLDPFVVVVAPPKGTGTPTPTNKGKGKISRSQKDAIVDISAGALARGGAGLVLMPATVLKVRFESTVYPYTSLLSACQDIVRTEGWRGMFRGYGATFIRDAPQAGLYVFAYERCKRALQAAPHPLAPALHTPVSALLAALLSTLATQPFDTAKTLIQLFPARYPSLPATVRTVWREQGVRGFFRGAGVRTARKVGSQVVAWTVFEECVRRAGKA